MLLALRTQQVIAHETGVARTIDPLGGSYYLEELTDRLEAEAYDYFRRIDELGGVIAAIRDNFFQREIAEASFRYQAEVEAEERIVVGVNHYELDETTSRSRSSGSTRSSSASRSSASRRCGRAATPAAVEAALAELKQAAAGDRNLMEPIVAAAKAYVTMGEMCEALREVWGTWRETPVF